MPVISIVYAKINYRSSVPLHFFFFFFFLQPSEVSEDVADDAVDSDNEDEPDLTPADMAAYLYETQQFEAFYAAMDRLVNESKVSTSNRAGS